MSEKNEQQNQDRNLNVLQDQLGMSLKTASELMNGEGIRIQLSPEATEASEATQTFVDQNAVEITGRPIISIFAGKNLHEFSPEQIDDPVMASGIVYKVLDLRASGQKYEDADFVLVRKNMDSSLNDVTPIPAIGDPQNEGAKFGRSYSGGKSVGSNNDLAVEALRFISREAGEISAEINPHTDQAKAINIRSTSQNNLYIYSAGTSNIENVNRIEPRPSARQVGSIAASGTLEIS